MSYCVNCGVELVKGAVKCPLCSVRVVNPAEENTVPENDKPYSDKVLIPKNIQRKFIAYIITMILLIPNIILFLVNIFFYKQSFWSMYFISSAFLVWTVFVFPFFLKKFKPYLMWGLNSAAIILYSFVLAVLTHSSVRIFLSVAVVCVLLALSSLIMLAWVRQKKRHWTAVLCHIFIDIFIISLVAGLLDAKIMGNGNLFYVGLISAACSFASALFFLYCNRSRHMRAWLNKVFYI